jgi:uncharacterized membrane protein
MEVKAGGAVFLTIVIWSLIPIIDKVGLGQDKVHPLAGLTIRLLAGLVVLGFLLPLLPETRHTLTTLSWKAWVTFAASGVLSLLLGQYFYYQALQAGSVGRVFPLLFGAPPVVSMLLAWWFLGEALTRTHVAGGLLITLGTVLLLR